MKQVKWFAIVLFAVALVVTVGYKIVELQNADASAPQIEMDEDVVTVSVTATEDEILQGVRAFDEKDGDVTDSLCIESISNFITNGEREVSILAFDGDGHIAKATRTLRYSDYTPTRFNLSAQLRFPVGTTKIAANLTATDCLDGDISKWIVLHNANDSSFDEKAPGEYPVEFSISNSAGAVEKFTATVVIYESVSGAPWAQLSTYLTYISKGSTFVPSEYIYNITVDGVTYQMTDGELLCATDLQAQQATPERKVDVRSYSIDDIDIESNVNTEVPGWYEVSYSLTNTDGLSRTSRLIVCVEE